MHLLRSAIPLIAENRVLSNSRFKSWLDTDAVQKGGTMLAYQLTKEQQKILEGTTVANAVEEFTSLAHIVYLFLIEICFVFVFLVFRCVFFLQIPVGKI